AADDLQQLLDEVITDLQTFERLVPALAPEVEVDLLSTISRAERLIDFLGIDVARGDSRRIETSLRLLEDTMRDLEELSTLADMMAGRSPDGAYAAMPPNWAPPLYPAPRLQASLTLMDARELRFEILTRSMWLRRANRKQLAEEGEDAAR